MSNNINSQYLIHLDEKIGVDTSSTPLSLTALTRVMKDVLENKLGSIQTFLDKDSGVNFHNTNIEAKLDIANGHHTTGNTNHTTTHTKLDTLNTTLSGGTQTSVLMGRSDITDSSTNKVIQTNTSGQLNTNVVNSVNVETHGHTDIADTNTSVRNHTNSLGSQIILEAPPIYPSQTSLGNVDRLNSGFLDGLSDVIDMNGFRNVAITIKINANGGQTLSGGSEKVYVYASFDNSTFYNTGDYGTLYEATEGGVSGEYKTFIFNSNFGARYLKIGGHAGLTGVSATSVNYVRWNGGF
tara:strand:+ start:378 stop:1265 length:888 start_codon:yes stop_codon:yes gene_type:complete